MGHSLGGERVLDECELEERRVEDGVVLHGEHAAQQVALTQRSHRRGQRSDLLLLGQEVDRLVARQVVRMPRVDRVAPAI